MAAEEAPELGMRWIERVRADLAGNAEALATLDGFREEFEVRAHARARGRAFARGAPARVRATRAECAAGRRARRRHHAGNRSRCNGARCERAPRACPTCGVLGLSLGRLRESTGGGTATHFFS